MHFSVNSVSCLQYAINNSVMATDQTDAALQCLQLTLLALSSSPSIWESEQS